MGLSLNGVTNNNPSLVLVQPRKTHPYITGRLLMGCKESNQTNKNKITNKYSDYSFHNQTVENVQSAKYLGISDNMDWGQHISEISPKATETLGFLCRNLAFAPFKEY